MVTTWRLPGSTCSTGSAPSARSSSPARRRLRRAGQARLAARRAGPAGPHRQARRGRPSLAASEGACGAGQHHRGGPRRLLAGAARSDSRGDRPSRRGARATPTSRSMGTPSAEPSMLSTSRWPDSPRTGCRPSHAAPSTPGTPTTDCRPSAGPRCSDPSTTTPPATTSSAQLTGARHLRLLRGVRGQLAGGGDEATAGIKATCERIQKTAASILRSFEEDEPAVA